MRTRVSGRFGKCVGACVLTTALAHTLNAQTVQYASGAGVEYRSLPRTEAIARAESALAQHPNDVQLIIALGVAQSGAWQFREAIETFSRGLEIAPNDPMLYRWRGHRYISVRDFTRGAYDLWHGLKLDSTNYGILYHLGIDSYAGNQFASAAKLFARAQQHAPDANELAGATDWLWMSLSRAGRLDEANAMLDRHPDSLPATNAYARRLMLYRGQIAPESLITERDTGAVNLATLSYGLGNWYLIRNDTAQAREWFSRSIQTGGWPAFGFMMSEIDLHRIWEWTHLPNSASGILALLDASLGPLKIARDSALDAARRHSGTMRADSAYVVFRARVEHVLYGMEFLHHDAFQAMVYPQGPSGVWRRRNYHLPDSASQRDIAIADSITGVLPEYDVRLAFGEGDAYFIPHEERLLKAFRQFLSPAGRDLARMDSVEQRNVSAEDADIKISYDELSNRLAAADQFLSSYPSAIGRDRAKGFYHFYLALYLAGADNSLAFDRPGKQLRPELCRSYEGYVRAHGATTSGRIIAEYLRLLEKSHYKLTAAVKKFLRGHGIALQ